MSFETPEPPVTAFALAKVLVAKGVLTQTELDALVALTQPKSDDAGDAGGAC